MLEVCVDFSRSFFLVFLFIVIHGMYGARAYIYASHNGSALVGGVIELIPTRLEFLPSGYVRSCGCAVME